MTSSSAVNLAQVGFGGIDTSTLVTSLVALQQQPITAMQSQQQNYQAATTTLSQFSQTLSALSTAATALSDPTTFNAMKASSSDSTVVATASGSPAAGQWSVSVSKIAQTQRTISNGVSDSTAPLGLEGTFEIALGSGKTANISLASSDSLSDVANKIASSGLRVQAQVLYDGTQSHLLVSGLDTGSANAVSFDESGLTSTSGYTLGLSTPKNTIQASQDASLTVGGVAITSATNQIANAIPGVTLAITQPTTAPATISIGGDSSGVASNVQAFVSAYNAVVSAGHTDAGYGSSAAQIQMLQGDQGIQTSLDQLATIAGRGISGASGAYTTLGSVGITLQDDGTLAFDQSKFTAAMQADPTSVQKIFVDDASTGAKGIMSAFGSAVSQLTTPTSGVLEAEMDGFKARTSSLTSRISDAQTRLTAYQTQLQQSFTQMNTMLAQYKNQANTLTGAFNSGSSSSSSSNSIP